MDSSGNFYLDGNTNGYLFWNNSSSTLTVSGNINAKTGSIGGVKIESSKVFTGTGTYNSADTPFYFDSAGKFSLKDRLFWDGSLLTVNGTVSATAGKIGGWTISSNKLINGSTSFDANGDIYGGGLTGYDTPTGQNGWYFGTDGRATIGTAGSSNNRLLWTGTQLRVYGGIYVMDTVGIRNGGSTTLTITGGTDNGVNNGAQLDLVPFSGTGHAQLQAASKAGADIYFRTGNAGGTPAQGYIRAVVHDDGLVEVQDAGDTTNAGNLYVNANVGVGTAASTSGTGKVNASEFISSSSKRFKNNIRDISSALDTVKALKGVKFDWINKNVKDDIGFIAEEVETLLPTLIDKDKDGLTQGLDYGKITALLVEAIKELAQKIDSK